MDKQFADVFVPVNFSPVLRVSRLLQRHQHVSLVDNSLRLLQVPDVSLRKDFQHDRTPLAFLKRSGLVQREEDSLVTVLSQQLLNLIVAKIVERLGESSRS